MGIDPHVPFIKRFGTPLDNIIYPTRRGLNQTLLAADAAINYFNKNNRHDSFEKNAELIEYFFLASLQHQRKQHEYDIALTNDRLPYYIIYRN